MNGYSIVKLLDSGELEIKFGRRARLQISPWEDGFRLHNVCGKRCSPAGFHYLSLITPEIEGRNDRGIHTFLSSIPVPVRDAVRSYSGFAQVSLIHWSRQFNAAYDLLHSNPLLLWLMAIGIYDGRIKIEHVSGLLDQKQQVILSRLTRTDVSRSAVKMMSKIPLEQADLAEGRVLLDTLANEKVVRLLRHTQRIPTSLLGLFDQNPASADPAMLPMLTSWAEKTTYERFLVDSALRGVAAVQQVDLHRNGKKLSPQSRNPSPDRSIKTCRSKNALQKLRTHRTQELTVEDCRSQTRNSFPAPPIPDNDQIQAVRSVAELEAESRKMSHCVRSHRDSIEKGACYIYRVLYPERGTLEVRRHSNGALVLGQFKLAKNREPSKESWLYVKKLFEDFLTI